MQSRTISLGMEISDRGNHMILAAEEDALNSQGFENQKISSGLCPVGLSRSALACGSLIKRSKIKIKWFFQ
jgi:hypothetical protein